MKDASKVAVTRAAGGEVRFTLGEAASYPTVREVWRVFGICGAALVAAAIAVAIANDGAWRLWVVPAGFLYGIFGWTLVEYVFHRWVLHWEPRDPLWRRVRRLLPGHRSHHNDPFDPAAIVNRKHAVGLSVALALLLLNLAAGHPLDFVLAAIGGGAFGYAAYEFVHFACHTLPMRGPILGRLKRHHAIHHHRDETVNFGVTSPFWDHVFRTAFRPARARD